MRNIILQLVSVIMASCAQMPNPEISPLESMVGKWSVSENECNEKWVRYSLSKDKKKQILKYSTGESASADILEVRRGKFHLQYEGETRESSNGELVSWWFIYHGEDVYRMRRNDWSERMRTKGSWVRCSIFSG